MECNRRQLLKKAGYTAPVLLAAHTLMAQTPAVAPAGSPPKWIADTDPVAKALGYVADASKVERPKKGEVLGKDQFCNNCQFYTKGSPIDGKEAGKCLMLPSGAVAGAGWCKSWAKKA